MIRRLLVVLSLLAVVLGLVASAAAASPPVPEPAAGSERAGRTSPKSSRSPGGGAVSTVDPEATKVGLDVPRRRQRRRRRSCRGGHARCDRALLLRHGWWLLRLLRRRGNRVHDRRTGDGTSDMTEDAFVENGVAIPFAEAVTSGLSVGTPGTPLTWQRALDEWGRCPCSTHFAARSSSLLADSSSTRSFRQQTLDNLDRFDDFTLDPGAVPARRGCPRGRLGLPQPRSGVDLRATRHSRRGLAVRRPPRPRGRRDLRSNRPSSRARLASSVLACSSDPTWPPTMCRSASRRSSTIAGSTSTAWRRPPAVGRRSARR